MIQKNLIKAYFLLILLFIGMSFLFCESGDISKTSTKKENIDNDKETVSKKHNDTEKINKTDKEDKYVTDKDVISAIKKLSDEGNQSIKEYNLSKKNKSKSNVYSLELGYIDSLGIVPLLSYKIETDNESSDAIFTDKVISEIMNIVNEQIDMYHIDTKERFQNLRSVLENDIEAIIKSYIKNINKNYIITDFRLEPLK